MYFDCNSFSIWFLHSYHYSGNAKHSCKYPNKIFYVHIRYYYTVCITLYSYDTTARQINVNRYNYSYPQKAKKLLSYVNSSVL